MDSPTKIVFIWHMHQPYYKLPSQKYYYLGWMRLHAVKDYYGMAKIVEKFDKLKVTFNFSGVLIRQLYDYIYNDATDSYALLTLKNPRFLTKKEKEFIIDRFFSVNFERFIRPHKRYFQLYQKKMKKEKFSPQDILDLQVLFNLCWFHPYTFKEDKNLQEIVKKEKDYSSSDKKYILQKQKEVMRQIFPLYKKLLENERIEISVSAFYHPILPLIYDTDILKEFPYLKRPRLRFSSPQDISWHLKKAKEIFEEIFKKTPYGSWPPEGGISSKIVPFFIKEGFSWIGLDEGILFKSLVTDYVNYDLIKNQRHLIYRPYEYEGLKILFRDRNLSDAISFVYQAWEEPLFAAQDLIEHFRRIHYYLKDIFKEKIVTIIMDGENAWEYYKNNGVDFLEKVYTHLEKEEIFSTELPHQIFENSKPKKLPKLASGSWINNDFGVWIGSEKNNICWEILRKIKDLMEKKKKEIKNIEKLEEYFHILEGSDWNWWNTFDEPTGSFRKIYLSYVKKIFQGLREKPPKSIEKL